MAVGPPANPHFGTPDAAAKAATGLAPARSDRRTTGASYSVPVEREGYADPGANYRADAALMRSLHIAVSAAQAAFEARFTYAALAHVDAAFNALLREQHARFIAACVRGNSAEIEKHGEATVRGFQKALALLQAQRADDDAYRVYPATDAQPAIAVAFDKAPCARVLKVHGHRVVFITVAELLELVDDRKLAAAIAAKRTFPGAEVMPAEPKRQED